MILYKKHTKKFMEERTNKWLSLGTHKITPWEEYKASLEPRKREIYQ